MESMVYIVKNNKTINFILIFYYKVEALIIGDQIAVCKDTIVL